MSLTARELEAMMIRTFGPKFRDKAIVNAGGSFRLADAFEECGWRDPGQPVASPLYGLYQFSPVLISQGAFSPTENARVAAARYLRECGESIGGGGAGGPGVVVWHRPLRRVPAPWWARAVAWALAAYYALRR